MTRCKLLVPAAIFAVLVVGEGVVSAYTGEELAKDAKVTLPEARAIALKAFPGKITDEELEKEKGGSGLRYSFDIKKGGVTHEVAETALAQLAREKLRRLDDARSLSRQLFRTEVDLIPDQQNKAPSVCLHPVTTQAHHEVVRHICEDLTATESVFPGTDLRLIYEISGSS